jgi:hypothetical protein
MGFAYQAFPRFKHTSLWRPRLAFSALPMMIVGILLQTIAHLLSPPSLSQTLEITPKTKVGDVLSRYPESLDIFVRHGFTPLRNPVLRKTMARVITIEQACRREGVDMNELLNDLIQVRGETGLSSTPLVSITSELRPDGLR